MTEQNLNTDKSNSTKPVLAEVFIGSIDEIREYFSRKYCRIYGIDENKWKHIAPSSIDGLKVRNKDNGFEFSFWAGSSGTNNMAVDKTGGCHDLSFHRSYTFEVVV